ncbi:G-protein coupled receptor 157, partial [Crocuta crocuta]
CALSALGSGLLVATHALWPDLRSRARRLLLFLSLADLLSAASYFYGVLQDFAGPSWDCVLQGALSTFANTSSFFWTVAIALYLYLSIVHAAREPRTGRLLWAFHVVSWGVPLAITAAAVALKKIGYDASDVSVGWCWIDLEAEDRVLWMLLTGKLWEMLAYVTLPVLYLLIRKHINRAVGTCGPPAPSPDLLVATCVISRGLFRVSGAIAVLAGNSGKKSCSSDEVAKLFLVLRAVRACSTGVPPAEALRGGARRGRKLWVGPPPSQAFAAWGDCIQEERKGPPLALSEYRPIVTEEHRLGRHASAADKKLVLIPLIFICLRVWSTVRFVLTLCGSPAVRSPVLVVLHGIGNTFQGGANCIMFVLCTRAVRTRLFSCCGRCCPSPPPARSPAGPPKAPAPSAAGESQGRRLTPDAPPIT